MSKKLSEQLLELKDLMPPKYQASLAERLKDVEPWRIKKAFSGQSQPSEVLRKIFRAASKLAKQHQQEMKKAQNVVDSLKSIAQEGQ